MLEYDIKNLVRKTTISITIGETKHFLNFYIRNMDRQAPHNVEEIFLMSHHL